MLYRRLGQRSARGLRRHPRIYEKRDIVADPCHPDYNEIKAWLGDYDPDGIDEQQIKIGLGRIAKQKYTAKPRLKTPES